jgi:hypothetical protein
MRGNATALGVLHDAASDRAALHGVGSRRVKADMLVSLLAALLVLPRRIAGHRDGGHQRR